MEALFMLFSLFFSTDESRAYAPKPLSVVVPLNVKQYERVKNSWVLELESSTGSRPKTTAVETDKHLVERLILKRRQLLQDGIYEKRIADYLLTKLLPYRWVRYP